MFLVSTLYFPWPFKRGQLNPFVGLPFYFFVRMDVGNTSKENDLTRLINSLALGNSSSTISGGNLQKNPPRQLIANPIQFSEPGALDIWLIEFRWLTISTQLRKQLNP